MNNIKKRKVRIIDLVMILLVTTFGALFFLCITRSIDGISLMNPWVSSMVCAVIFEMLLIIFAITVGVKRMIAPIVMIAFLPSIIFTPIIWHMLIVVLAAVIAMQGLYVMRHTLFNSLKIDVSTIVKSGIAHLSFALVIVITSQYYFFIEQNANIVFDAGNYIKTSNVIFDYILKTGNVEGVSINTMTVDDFIAMVIEKTYEQKQSLGPQIDPADKDIMVRLADQVGVMGANTVVQDVKKQAAQQMLTSISELIGREVAGQEIASDVASEIVSVKIDELMTKNEFLRKNRATIFTVFFFLIIFSLASIVKIGTGLTTRFIFMILREFNVIKVTKTKRDAEVIML
jgi:hypothetical protein